MFCCWFLKGRVVKMNRGLSYLPSLFVGLYDIYLYFTHAFSPMGLMLFMASCGVFGLSLALLLSGFAAEGGNNAPTLVGTGKKPVLDLDRVNKLKRTVFELQKTGYDVDLDEDAAVVIEGIPFKLVKLLKSEDEGSEMVFKPISTTESEA